MRGACVPIYPDFPHITGTPSPRLEPLALRYPVSLSCILANSGHTFSVYYGEWEPRIPGTEVASGHAPESGAAVTPAVTRGTDLLSVPVVPAGNPRPQ
eukprot:6614826-Pyramimonas_sp.AAC.1